MGKKSADDIDVYYFPIFSGKEFLYTFRVHPNSSDLKNESVSRSQLVEYAKDKGYSQTKNLSSTLSNSTVVSEIGNNTPIYAGCAGSAT